MGAVALVECGCVSVSVSVVAVALSGVLGCRALAYVVLIVLLFGCELISRKLTDIRRLFPTCSPVYVLLFIRHGIAIYQEDEVEQQPIHASFQIQTVITRTSSTKSTVHTSRCTNAQLHVLISPSYASHSLSLLRLHISRSLHMPVLDVDRQLSFHLHAVGAHVRRVAVHRRLVYAAVQQRHIRAVRVDQPIVRLHAASLVA